MLTYFIILGTAIAGALQVSVWAAVVGACLLALTSIIEHRRLGAGSSIAFDPMFEPVQALSAFMTASAAAGAALMLGRASAWLWLD